MGTLTPWRSLLCIAFLAIGTSLTLAVVHHARAGPAVADHAILEMVLMAFPEEPPTLGPYSRFGWHHPGPMMYYLLAPGYWASGWATWSLFVGSALLSVLSLVGTFAILWRHLSREALALLAIAALILTNYLSAEILTDPWNPYIALMLFLLCLVLGAEVLQGNGRCWPLLIIVSSYLVQTHIGYGPIVLTLALVILGSAVFRRGGPTRRWSRHGIAAALLFVFCWAPPVHEQMSHRPGNIERVASYLRSDLARAVGSGGELGVLSQWCALPLYVIGAMPSASPRTDHVEIQPAGTIVVRTCTTVQLVLIAFVVVRATRRRDRFHAALAGASLAVLAIALISSHRIHGPQLAYLYHWIVPGGFVGWVAIVGTLIPKPVRTSARTRSSWGRVRTHVVFLLGATLLVASIADTWNRHHSMFRSEQIDSRRIAVTDLADLISGWEFARGGESRLTFDLSVWPVASGLLLELDKRGLRIAGPATHPDLIGPLRAHTGTSEWELMLTPEATPIERPERVIGSSKGVRLIETHVPDLIWGAGWLSEGEWGRWANERNARLYLPAHEGGVLTLEWSGFESMHDPQSVEIATAEGVVLKRFVVDGIPWEWHMVQCEVPRHTRVVDFRFGSVYRHQASGRYFALPVRNARLSERDIDPARPY